MAELVEFLKKTRQNLANKEEKKDENIPSNQAIAKQLQRNNIRKDDMVTDIYLADENLVSLSSCARFKNLQRLWVNNNKLCTIKDSLSTNFCLVELYLQNNKLISITGTLRHLRNLRVLMLQNNQIKNVEAVVAELEKMHDLKILNLFDNPVCQEVDYRSYVIQYIPSVEVLDRSEVLRSERDSARRQYDQDYEAFKETVAFGRRSEGPPVLHHRREINRPPTVPVDVEIGNNFFRSNPPYGSVDEAFHARLAKKSAMQFSHFDWSSMPSSAVRRTNQKPGLNDPQIVTVKFR